MKKLKLTTPIPFGSEMIQELTFQAPKARHIRHLPKDYGMNEMLNLAAILSGTPDSVIDELSAEDAISAIGVVNSFFQNSQGIIPTS